MTCTALHYAWDMGLIWEYRHFFTCYQWLV